MSNANLYGHIDRRRKVPLEEFRVRDVYNAILEEHGVPRMKPVSHDGIENMERLSLRKASRSVEIEDRVDISVMANTLKEKLHIGTDAALSILAHVGVYLNAVR